MSITNFSYTIFAVNEAARCMEVIYTADGHQTMHVGVRLPFEGESLEDVIRAFAPISLWDEQTRVVVAPAVGVSGTLEVFNAPQPSEAVGSTVTTGTQTL